MAFTSNLDNPTSSHSADVPSVPGLPQHADTTKKSGSAALVVLHDWYGLDDETKAAAGRLQEAGFVTYTPDLFASGAPPEGANDGALAGWTQGLADSALTAEVIAAVDRLAAHEAVDSARIGVVGWGWGGTYALIAAAHDRRLAAAASIGGEISYPSATAKRPGSPLNFVAGLNGAFFGAYPEADPLFPAIEVGRLRARLREDEKANEIKVYEGAGPRFWRDANAPQTALLWRRLQQFLEVAL